MADAPLIDAEILFRQPEPALIPPKPNVDDLRRNREWQKEEKSNVLIASIFAALLRSRHHMAAGVERDEPLIAERETLTGDEIGVMIAANA